jgi:hypothetical protein
MAFPIIIEHSAYHGIILPWYDKRAAARAFLFMPETACRNDILSYGQCDPNVMGGKFYETTNP